MFGWDRATRRPKIRDARVDVERNKPIGLLRNLYRENVSWTAYGQTNLQPLASSFKYD